MSEPFAESAGIGAAARRVMERCDILSRFSEAPDALTRTFLSPPMHDVHTVLGGWMRDAGLTVRVDAVGNIIGRCGADNPDAPVLILGSHLDTVPNAGRFDGILGVLLGLAVVEAFRGAPLPIAIDIVGFSEEEGVRFQVPYLGSKAVCGQLDDSLLALTDDAGVNVKGAIRAFGLDPAGVAAAYDPDTVLGYVETHIEQGPVLEAAGQSVGVVKAIAGQTRARLRFTGSAAHAGTTPMNLRRDALAGAAEFISAVETVGFETEDLVATVGFLTVEPNAGNVVPSAVELSLDVRHASDSSRMETVNTLMMRANQAANLRRLTLEVVRSQDFAAVSMDYKLRHRLISAIGEGEALAIEMVSGAGHDAAIMASIAPAAMLFVRSLNGGLSHHPDESVLVEDVEVALRTLSKFVALTLLDHVKAELRKSTKADLN